jgi:hypothetical protein
VSYTAYVTPKPRLSPPRPDESLRQWVARVDPEVEAAVDDVDRTLLRASLALSPLERLRACSQATAALAAFRRVPS